MRNPDLLDSLCWSFLSALVLLLLPVGHVTPDGIGQSITFSAGFINWNPNHLLVEPFGAWWMSLASLGSGEGSRAEAVDHLRRLSILAGSLAAGLFRFGVARRLTSTRLAANHATAWLAFGSAFARLWVMDEAYMTQMPAVVAVAWLVLRYLERPSFLRALAAGASVTLAAAFFVSNLLLGPALAVALASRPKHALGVLLGTFATAGAVFEAAHIASGSPYGLLDWMTRYSGGGQPLRVESAYGTTDLLVSTARAVYGAACSLVDLAPLVATWRDLLALDTWVFLRIAAFVAGCWALLSALRLCLRGRSDPANRGALLLFGAWTMAVLAFGIYWNNSDDQFFVQLAVAFAALGARLPLKGRAAALGLAMLLSNVVDVGHRRAFYPREERLASLERELGKAGLIVYPGFDEMEALLALRPVAPSIPIARYAVRVPAEEGLEDLFFTIFDVLQDGRDVAVVDIAGVHPSRPPWKFLKRMGYDQARVEDTLDSFALKEVPEQVGPFSVSWIRSPR